MVIRPYIPISTLTAGLCGFIFYMYSIQLFERYIVPEGVLWVSLVLISGSLVYLGRMGTRKTFLLALFLASVCIGFWFRLRFGDRALFPDIFSEIATAQNVRTFGLTAGLIENNRYGDALSITILPTVLSQILGVDVIEVFLYVFPIVLALIPISIYLVIEKAFRPDTAALASVLFLFDYVNLTLNQFVVRDSFGILFFLLSLLCLLRVKRNSPREYSACFMMLVFGALSSSHTPGYFFVVLILLLSVSPFLSKMCRRLHLVRYEVGDKSPLPSALLLFVVVIGLTWMVFVGSLDLAQMLQQGIIQGIIQSLEQLTYGQHNLFSSYLFSFPRGNDISNMVTVGYRVCIVAGFFYAIYAEAKNAFSFGLTMWGGLVLFLLPLWLFLSINLSRYTVFPDRLYSYGLVMFSVFVAFALLKVSKIYQHASRRLLQYVGVRRVFPACDKLFVMTVLVLFVLNSVYVMPTIYHSPSSSIPTAQAITTGLFGKSEFSVKLWKADYVPSNAHLYTDDLYSHISILVRDVQWKNETNYPVTLLSLLDGSQKVPSDSYLLVPGYVNSYGYVIYAYYLSPYLQLPKDTQIRYEVPTFIVVQMDRRVIDSRLGKLNLIYSSGDYTFFASSQ